MGKVERKPRLQLIATISKACIEDRSQPRGISLPKCDTARYQGIYYGSGFTHVFLSSRMWWTTSVWSIRLLIFVLPTCCGRKLGCVKTIDVLLSILPDKAN
jgi:hypothetical protein